MIRAVRSAAMMVVAAMVIVGCTGVDRDEPPSEAVPGPGTALDPEAGVGQLATDVLTVPDPLPAGSPGDVVALAARSGADVPQGARAWDVIYRSEGVNGEAVAVSGVVYAPDGPAPAGGRPVLSWAHGTVGIADSCAPSHVGPQVPALDRWLDAGYVVTATDYEGLGTPGVHPYLVGDSAGRSVLDAARTASRIDEAGASSRVVAFGHSQGGHAVLFAGKLAPQYAPELDLLGVVASAPAAELRTLLRSAVPISLGFGLVASALYSYSETYDDLDLSEVLTSAAISRIGVVEETCLQGVTDAFVDQPTSAWLVTNPVDLETWARRAEENEPGSSEIAAPVLVVQGANDYVVLASSTDTAIERLCQAGNTIDYRRYPSTNHGEILGEAEPDIFLWVADRVSGGDAGSTCGG